MEDHRDLSFLIDSCQATHIAAYCWLVMGLFSPSHSESRSLEVGNRTDITAGGHEVKYKETARRQGLTS